MKVATKAKFLGLWVDDQLKWHKHIQKLIIKLVSRKSLLLRGKNLLTFHAKRVLYFAQIQSNLTYGLLIWGSMMSVENKNKLEKLQNKCIQIIDPISPLAEIYKQNKILKINQLVLLENCKTWYKCYHNLLPNRLSKLMKEDQHGSKLEKKHKYETRKKEEINLPLATSQLYRNSFYVLGLKEFSQLCTEIKEEKQYKRFVCHCKDYLLGKAE